MIEEVVILGVDPGTHVTGYGLIRIEAGRHIPVDYGCIRPPTKLKLTDRYLIIHNCIETLIDKYKPTVVVVETQYVNRNVQSALKLGMARGTVMVAAKRKGLPVFEYAPSKAKRAVVGNGAASKCQVKGMIQKLLDLGKLPPEDAADALALAICHAHASNGFIKPTEI